MLCVPPALAALVFLASAFSDPASFSPHPLPPPLRFAGEGLDGDQVARSGEAPVRTSLAGEVRYGGAESGPVVVRLYRLRETSSGRVVALSKADVLGGAEPVRSQHLPAPGPYAFSDLEDGSYSVLGFMDLDGNDVLGFDPPEPFGWFAAEAAGGIASVRVGTGGLPEADVVLRTTHPFPREDRVAEHGALRWMKGLPVLQLHGTAQQRGYAHGFLVGEQIVDFFEFYVLEDSWRSARRYEEVFVPFLDTHFAYDPAYVAEVDAVIQGMKDSGMDMRVEWLGRDFTRTELLAINAYIERRATQPSPAAASTCTQFAAWGEATDGGELAGGLIAGRNMDGEVDIRKVTVSHFLLFAVDPSEPGRRRWVSTMWPGFVGTLSGINEEGLYSMENAGGDGWVARRSM